ncbi:SCP2 sterol-binding domain-containing protein [Amorphus orientalis]|uniref:Sterol carrier protein n=1 Tax=Amorphus orientalis TaxID=649198 RepID=A0AAE3VKV0_9HYPH|nr:SCP2 sterol-binding domain-containing protein [Amorphus orientalis]MDQ0314334.1 putative sterol carrier protein [Amorphus orientalis]
MADMATLLDTLEDKADALEGLGYKVRMDLTDGGRIFIDGTADPVEIREGDDEADTVLKLSSDNLMKLVEGRLSPMIAFSTGRLKVEGSQGVALKLAALFESD